MIKSFCVHHSWVLNKMTETITQKVHSRTSSYTIRSLNSLETLAHLCSLLTIYIFTAAKFKSQNRVMVTASWELQQGTPDSHWTVLQTQFYQAHFSLPLLLTLRPPISVPQPYSLKIMLCFFQTSFIAIGVISIFPLQHCQVLAGSNHFL